MKIACYFASFTEDESGAVTVDWVVLTAAVIGLGVAAAGSIGSGGADLADDIQANLTNTEIASYIPVTFGALVGTAFADPMARTCQPMRIDLQGNISGGGCNTNSQASGIIRWYEMSDGSQWRHAEMTTITYLTDTQDSETTSTFTSTWYTADGEEVDAPEAT